MMDHEFTVFHLNGAVAYTYRGADPRWRGTPLDRIRRIQGLTSADSKGLLWRDHPYSGWQRLTLEKYPALNKALGGY